MDTTWLRVFTEVVRRGSFTAAATALGYTQSAISRQISALEADVGSTLFDRLPRGVALTEEGELFERHATAALSHVDAATRELKDLRDLTTGHLRVAAIATASAALVPRAMGRFTAAHPDIRVRLVEGLTAAHVKALEAGEVDVAVITSYHPEAPELSALDLLPLGEDPILVALPAGHRFAGRERIGLAELTEETWIAGFAEAERTLFASVIGGDVEPRVDFVVQEWTAKLGCVAAGLGVTLMPSLAASSVRGDVVLAALDAPGAPVRGVYAATPAGRAHTPAVTAFLPMLTAEAATILAR